MSPLRRSKPTRGTRRPHRPPRPAREGALPPIFIPGADLRAVRGHSDDPARSLAEKARVTDLDAEGSRAAAARDSEPRRPSARSLLRFRTPQGAYPGASVPLATLPGPAVLVMLVARLEEVQTSLADEDPRPIGLDSNTEECRALCLAAVAGLLADAFGLPDVRSTPGRARSSAPAMQPLGAVAPRLHTSNRGAAILA